MSEEEYDAVLDVSGIDRAELLAALYNGVESLPDTIAYGDDLRRKMVPEDVQEVFAQWAPLGGSLTNPKVAVDYMRGRPIKVTLDGTTLREPRNYDRNAEGGPGSCRRIVTRLHMRVVK